MKKQPAPPDEYCPECMSLKRKPNKECVNHEKYWIGGKDVCPWCLYPKKYRNPSGKCDHLYESTQQDTHKDTLKDTQEVIDELSTLMVKNIANKHIKVQDTHEGKSHQRHWYLVAQKMLKKLVKEYERVCKGEYSV